MHAPYRGPGGDVNGVRWGLACKVHPLGSRSQGMGRDDWLARSGYSPRKARNGPQSAAQTWSEGRVCQKGIEGLCVADGARKRRRYAGSRLQRRSKTLAVVSCTEVSVPAGTMKR